MIDPDGPVLQALVVLAGEGGSMIVNIVLPFTFKNVFLSHVDLEVTI